MQVAIYDEGPKGFAFYCERSELSSAFNDPDFAIYSVAPRGPFDHRLYRLRNRDWKSGSVRVTPEVKILYLMPFQSCTIDCVDHRLYRFT